MQNCISIFIAILFIFHFNYPQSIDYFESSSYLTQFYLNSAFLYVRGYKNETMSWNALTEVMMGQILLKWFNWCKCTISVIKFVFLSKTVTNRDLYKSCFQCNKHCKFQQNRLYASPWSSETLFDNNIRMICSYLN